MSDEPAMHEESLNVRSFAKRGASLPEYMPGRWLISTSSLAEQGPLTNDVRFWPVLPHMPNQSNAPHESAFKLSSPARSMSLHRSACL